MRFMNCKDDFAEGIGGVGVENCFADDVGGVWVLYAAFRLLCVKPLLNGVLTLLQIKLKDI